ncbi:MAG: type I restriction enzyme HsdR N-terminal domain-containing protein [Bacteriovoracales bacterium]|nr:type I restriction enzyme HsdR N-terminal domain-containing protein [Bacteriovoracales bacterium]
MTELKQGLMEVLAKLKERILEVEKSSIKLTEQDTRQGLINLLFKNLGWDFSDFNLVKSEFRHKNYNDPVDYAFLKSKDETTPVLLVEAKALGVDLNNGKVVKQLCTYLGEMGVQWGLLTDGNKYIMYNSKAGVSFENQKFLTMQIKTVDTDDGLSLDELADKFIALLSRRCLENDEIQKTYESHVTHRHIDDALGSLLTTPFDTLASAIKKEFKEDRVRVDQNLKITQKQIISYLEFIKDEEGRIPIDTESEGAISEENILSSIASAQEDDTNISEMVSGKRKRITISDLLEVDLVREGDNWRFDYKGEVA